MCSQLHFVCLFFYYSQCYKLSTSHFTVTLSQSRVSKLTHLFVHRISRHKATPGDGNAFDCKAKFKTFKHAMRLSHSVLFGRSQSTGSAGVTGKRNVTRALLCVLAGCAATFSWWIIWPFEVMKSQVQGGYGK